MKTITFYSYKGGVGRSLLLANIATWLTELGQKVCMLDFDLEAPGLHYKFSTLLKNQNIEIKNGILDYINDFEKSGNKPSSLSDISYPFFNFSISNQAKAETVLIPAGNSESSDYWKKLSSIDWNELLFENTSGLAFFLNLKQQIKHEINPDYLLIDSRTGISQISGIALSILADDVVVIAANNKENIDGSKKIIKSISDPNNNILDKIPNITFVLSRIPFTEEIEDKNKEQNLINKLQRELECEICTIHSDRELEEDERIKIGFKKDGKHPQVSLDYLKIFEKLTIADFSEDQKTIFKNIKEAEQNYQRAISEESDFKKLEYIQKAIELNSSNKDYYLYRAQIHDHLNQYKQVIEDCEKVLKLDTQNIQAYELRGFAFMREGDFDLSRSSFEQILTFDESHVKAMLGISEIYFRANDYDKALSMYNHIIELNPENDLALIGKANVLIRTNNHVSALENIYQALTINPNSVEATILLAEVNLYFNNLNEFYLNIERAIQINTEKVENLIQSGYITRSLHSDNRFNKILEKYNLQYKI